MGESGGSQRNAAEPGNGGLERILITLPQATAEVYTHGAHVTSYEPSGQPPVIWMSKSSWFEPQKPIRGLNRRKRFGLAISTS